MQFTIKSQIFFFENLIWNIPATLFKRIVIGRWYDSFNKFRDTAKNADNADAAQAKYVQDVESAETSIERKNVI